MRWGTRLACLEMALSGTTTYTDMYYFEDTVAADHQGSRPARRAGADRHRLSRPGLQDAPQGAFAGTEEILQEVRERSADRAGVAPHAIYTNSDETLKASRPLADRYHKPLVIHLSETKTENDDSLAKRKKTPTAALDSLGVLNGWTVAAHGVWLDDADLKILKARDTGLAHYPSSNMKLASGVAPVVKILDLGIADGPRHRRRRRIEQRSRHDGGNGSRREAAEGHDRRSARAARRTGLRHGDHHRRARAASGQADRLARERQSAPT